MPPSVEEMLEVAEFAWFGVDPRDLEPLVTSGRLRELEAGEDLEVGAHAPVILLLSGLVALGNDVDGALRLPRTYVGGCVLNEERHLVEFLRDPGHRPADIDPPAARAILPTAILEIGDAAYEALLDSPAFLRATARRLKIEERVGNRLLTYQSAHDRETTFARVLVFLVNCGGILMHDRPALRVTQQQLAEISCLSLRHVNSSLKDLASTGLIERFKGGFLVLDEPGLFARAGHGNLSGFDRNRLGDRSD